MSSSTFEEFVSKMNLCHRLTKTAAQGKTSRLKEPIDFYSILNRLAPHGLAVLAADKPLPHGSVSCAAVCERPH